MGKIIIAALIAAAMCAGNAKPDSFTFDSREVAEIVEENYQESPIDWEITSINGEVCCLHTAEICEETELTLLFDFGNFAETLIITVDETGTKSVTEY